jgi:hypothetical protein
MTYNNIYEYFKDDRDLLKYYDPLSTAVNNEQASLEIYHKLIEYSKELKCKFIRLEHGYIFYAKPNWYSNRRMLISFCLKSEFRAPACVAAFWKEIQKHLGKRFTCCLFNKNTRAINFLMKGGMKVERSNEIITLLSI